MMYYCYETDSGASESIVIRFVFFFVALSLKIGEAVGDKGGRGLSR